ncbi:MAG: hypothetical protein QRY72_02520 [Candidatus Rhabdochlamydia sp.]
MLNAVIKATDFFTPAYISSGLTLFKYVIGKNSSLSSIDKQVAFVAAVCFIKYTISRQFSSSLKDSNGNLNNTARFVDSIFFLINPFYSVCNVGIFYTMLEFKKLNTKEFLSKEWNIALIKLLFINFLLSRGAWNLKTTLINKVF